MNLVKSNIFLLVVVVVLAVPTGMQLVSDSESFVDYARIPLMFDGFSPENVAKVQIAVPKAEQPAPDPRRPNQKPGIAYDQLVLQRAERGWSVAQVPGAPNPLAGAPASKQRVEVDIFEHLLKIRSDKETLIQANATEEQLAEYGLDDATATVIQAYAKETNQLVVSLCVGTDASDQLAGTAGVKGVFVRKKDSTDVVLYEFEKGWRRDIATDQWVDRVLLKVTPESVTRFALSNGATKGELVVFERSQNEAAWTCKNPPAGRGAVRQAEVEAALGRLRWISVNEFRRPLQQAGNLAVLGLLPGDIRFEITYRDGQEERTARFTVGKKVDDEQNVHYFQSSEVPFLMTWPAALATALELDIAQAWFDPDAPPAKAGDPKTGDPNAGNSKAGNSKAGGAPDGGNGK
ncbi:MAG: DUF4340 domain-containing protein [bacterium]|nr:DUF4340 domain-containing protein [bacterium]